MSSIQKRIIIYAVVIILLAFFNWYLSGFETLSGYKEVPVIKDNLIVGNGERFFWGLDLTLLVTGLTAILAGFFYMKIAKKNQVTEEQGEHIQ